MTAMISNPSTEENRTMRLPASNAEYFHYSISFFKIVCKKLCNLNTQQINSLSNFLKKETESGRNRKDGDPYIFTGQELYSTLLKKPACSEKCKKQNYNNWDDIIKQFG